MKKCLESWDKNLNDYEVIKWNEENFNINENIWVKEAYEIGKYAFVSDYVRLKVLYEYGGVYLDTDVEVLKSFDDLLNCNGFMGFENNSLLTSAIMGFEQHSPIVKEMLLYYENKSFKEFLNEKVEANVVMITNLMMRHGLVIENKFQNVNGINIYPKTYFCPLDFYMNKDFTENTYSIHYFNASWLDEKVKKEFF